MNDARPAGAVYLDARKKAAQRGADAALYACIDNNYGLFPGLISQPWDMDAHGAKARGGLS